VLTLITGVPGAGKTLWALNLVKRRAEAEGRTVYFNGVAELTLPWQLLESGERWHLDVPKGSLILIDEAQRVFRPRGTGAAVPDFVAQLEVHRHSGLDIVLVTQHPMLIDANVRRLVGQHFHVVRRFGSHFSTVHEWPSCTEIQKGALDDSVRHEFRFPKESFGWYKSAEVHTHKVRIPAKFWFLVASPLVIAGLVWFGYRTVAGYMDGTKGVTATVDASSAPGQKADKGRRGSGGTMRGLRTNSFAAAPDAEEYVLAYAPRLKGLAYTAPVYDEVTKVTRAPVPAACARSGDRCQCYSQDGTRLDVPKDLCAAIVRDGYFIPFEVKAPEALAVGSKEGQGPSGAAGLPGGAGPVLQTSVGPSGAVLARGGVNPASGSGGIGTVPNGTGAGAARVQR